MYAKWLRFYFSPLREVDVKGKKQQQEIKREWLDNGSLKVSGKQPSDWYVILNPAPSMNIRSYLYETKQQKKESLEKMRRAIEKRNKEMFNEAEKQFRLENENEKRSQSILSDDEQRKKKIEEKIFQAKKKLYLFRLKPKKDRPIATLQKLELDLNKFADEQRDIRREIDLQQREFNPIHESIQQKGPVPEPPIYIRKSRKKQQSIRKKRLENYVKRQTDELEKEEKEDADEVADENLELEESEDSEEDEDTSDENDQDGGYKEEYKVVKLDFPI